MKYVRPALAPLLFAMAGCATSSQQCDYVLFKPLHCVDTRKPLIASRATPLPERTAPPSVTPSHSPKVAAVVSPRAVEPQTVDRATVPVEPPPAQPASATYPEVPLNNAIYFDTGMSALTPGSKLTLDKIGSFLKELSNEKVKIAAYTDPTGSEAKNKLVAAQRSKSVVDYLGTQGIDSGRISILPHTLPKNDLAKSEYWRLRKAVVLYSDDVLAHIEKQETEDEQQAENAAKPDVHPKPLAVTARKEKEPKGKGKKALKEPEAPTKDGLEKIDVVYWKSVTHGLFIIAKKAGFFEQEGFDVRLHESKLEANELNIQLADKGTIKTNIPKSALDVKSSKYFMGAVCPYGYHEALSKKLPFVEIGSMLTIPNTIIAKKEFIDEAKKNLRNFKGTLGRLKILPNEIDTIYLLADRLKQVGLKEGVDFKFQFYDNLTSMWDAVFRGELTAAIASPPFDEELVSKHPGFGLFPLSTLNLNLPCCRQVVTRDNLRHNRGKYVRFERAVIRAQRYLIDHPVESTQILADFLSLPVSKVRGFLQRPGFSLSANPNVKGSIAFANTMANRIGKEKVGDIRESVDTSIYEEALGNLIKDDPNPIYESMRDVYNRTR